MVHDVHRVLKNNEHNILYNQKPNLPSGCHHTGCMATRALGHTMYGSIYIMYIYNVNVGLFFFEKFHGRKVATDANCS